MKTMIGILIGGLLGGVIGYWGILCPDGACPLTGSWYSSAFIGGLFGLFLSGGCPACCTPDARKLDDHPGPGSTVP